MSNPTESINDYLRGVQDTKALLIKIFDEEIFDISDMTVVEQDQIHKLINEAK